MGSCGREEFPTAMCIRLALGAIDLDATDLAELEHCVRKDRARTRDAGREAMVVLCSVEQVKGSIHIRRRCEEKRSGCFGLFKLL